MKCTSCNKSFSPEKCMFVSHAALAFAKIAWKTTKTHAWNAGHSLIVWIKSAVFLGKTGVSRKTLLFLARFYCLFILVLAGFFVCFSLCFSIKTGKSLLYSGFDYSFLFCDSDNFINRFVLNNLPLRLLFLLFFSV